MVNRVIKKALAGVEDITWGVETEHQIRKGQSIPITQINSEHLPHQRPDGSVLPVQSELYKHADDLNTLFERITTEFEGVLKTVKYSTFAEAGQTKVKAPYSGFETAEVFINGVRQDALKHAYYLEPTIQYTNFVFAEPLAEGDLVSFILGIGYEVTEYSNLETYTFEAVEGDTEFDLGGAVPSASLLVWINGVKQATSAYVLNGNLIQFSDTLTAGDLVEVVRFNRVQAQTQYIEPVALHKKEINSDMIITSDYNGFSISPTIAEGTTVTVSVDSIWLIL